MSTSNNICHDAKFKFSTGKQLQIFERINLLRLTNSLTHSELPTALTCTT
jgi:hypothetical protein